MEQVMQAQTAGEALAVIKDALDLLTRGDLLGLASDRDQLDLLSESIRVAARLHAWQTRLAARLEQSDAAWHEHQTSTSTYLTSTVTLTRREAARLIAAGQGLHRFAVVGKAAQAGAVLPSQAEAITTVLDKLPDDFPTPVVEEAQQMMVGFASTHNATELRRLTSHLLEVLSPDTADELEAARLDRQHRQAQADRHLRFTHDHAGSVLIAGSLPVTDAEAFIRIVDSYAAASQRRDEPEDPGAPLITPGMRRADGLIAMIHHHTQDALAPSHGGDRPRIVITLQDDTLRQAARDAGLFEAEPAGGQHRVNGAPGGRPSGREPSGGGTPCRGRLLGSGEPVPDAVLRQLLCDADLMPAVLGGPSEILDVGRTRRLVTPAIRAALDLRDGGCAFAGCDTPPWLCQAHHIVPWWAGGHTALHNLVLLCPHHHGTVEPSHDPTADRWQVRLRPDGVPEFLPPRRVPDQTPRVHVRFMTPRRA